MRASSSAHQLRANCQAMKSGVHSVFQGSGHVVSLRSDLFFKSQGNIKRRFFEDVSSESAILRRAGRVPNVCATEEHAGKAGESAAKQLEPDTGCGE